MPEIFLGNVMGPPGPKGDPGPQGPSGDGSGDMLKSVYDVNRDGVVDNAAMLGGKGPEAFASAIHTHSFQDLVPGADVLPVSIGGTGMRTLDGIQDLLGIIGLADRVGVIWALFFGELALAIQINGFNSLDYVNLVDGVWNKVEQRLEC